ncbi:MAG: hypothetical protein R3C68_05405 [Myxococcota bacterium]
MTRQAEARFDGQDARKKRRALVERYKPSAYQRGQELREIASAALQDMTAAFIGQDDLQACAKNPARGGGPKVFANQQIDTRRHPSTVVELLGRKVAARISNNRRT